MDAEVRGLVPGGADRALRGGPDCYPSTGEAQLARVSQASNVDRPVPRATLVMAARRWIGTPYVHQAARRGAGADCLGLIRGLWREFAGAEPEQIPAYSPDWSEASGDERLWQAALRHLRVTSTPREGSVLLFQMRRGAVAKHMGIVSGLGATCLGLESELTLPSDNTKPRLAPVFLTDDGKVAGAKRQNPEAIAAPLMALGSGGFELTGGGCWSSSTPRSVTYLDHRGSPSAFIHAYTGQGVVECSLSLPWSRRLVAAFDFPWISD